MGLNYPSDIEDWKQWQQKRSRVRRLRTILRSRSNEAPLYLTFRGDNPQVLLAVEATTPSAIAANLSPIFGLRETECAILSPVALDHLLPEGPWTTLEISPESLQLPSMLTSVKVALASGHFLPAGAKTLIWADQLGIRLTVIQHGLLTPFAPPLPHDAHLLAFSPQDAFFWQSGRHDVTSEIVGSQLLWDAAENSNELALTKETPVFLGQLHGAELPRHSLVKTTQSFCIRTGASYRPHPAEVDKLSRLQHAYWNRRGLHIDASRQNFAEISRPVVAIFSTGVLEAAARGLPAWVVYEGVPPYWLTEFWDRYSLSPWGKQATAKPERYELEPAVAITNYIKNQLGNGL